MSIQSKNQDELVDSNDALDVFIDSLFRLEPEKENSDELETAPEATTETISPPPKMEIISEPEPLSVAVESENFPPEIQPVVKITKPETGVRLDTAVEIEHVPESELEVKIEPIVVEEDTAINTAPAILKGIVDDEAEIQHVEIEPVQDEADAYPTEPFQTLIFTVGKLNVALPIKDISGIIKWPGGLASMPGKADWNLGIYSERGDNVSIVDTAKFIIPHNRSDLLPNENEYNHIILVADKKWGLACNDVSKVVSLSPEQVKWTGERNIRPWLAGTIIEQMCALLNVNSFVKLLEETI
jgi:purine-binding chemotaxis protein CheW